MIGVRANDLRIPGDGRNESFSGLFTFEAAPRRFTDFYMVNSAPLRDEALEIELLENTGRGDRASFRQLYERYSGVLFSTAYQVLNDPAEA